MAVACFHRYLWAAVLILLALVGCAPSDRSGSGQAVSNSEAAPGNTTTTTTAAASAAAEVPVRSITDGDTLTLADGRTVRLAQVDAPEKTDCFGSQSTAALRVLAGDKTVAIRRPTDGPEKEKYGRTLAEVSVGPVSVNEALVRDGAAEWYEQFADEDADLARRLRTAEDEARSAGRGLWSACSTTKSSAPTRSSAPSRSPAPPTTATTPPPVPSRKAGPAGAGCHPAYPDDCIPPAPPDLDCGSLRRVVRVDRRFGDPHGLDADNDGSGCESYG